MKLKKIIGYGLGGLMGLSALGVGGGLLWRASLQNDTEQARQKINSQMGVNELFKTRIGGVDQWIHARGVNRSDPVLLWLHGGPGTPMMPFQDMFQKDIERKFIVVHWDQRDSGKTYFENKALGINSYDMMLNDAISVVDLVKKRYSKNRIVVVGHSWGSMLGLGLVQARPQDISAYVGTGQVVDITQNETLGFQATLAEAKRLKNSVSISELNEIAPYPELDGQTPEAKIEVLRKWENTFGFGISRRYREKINDVMPKIALASPEYSLRDVSFFLIDTGPEPRDLDQDVDEFKASKWSSDYKVPMFLLLGRHDWQTPSTLAASWLNTVKAPSKKVIWFEKSAHSPMIDEPDAFAKALIEQVRPVALTSPQP